METVRIGDTGLVASRIGLGTWAIGGNLWGGADESESIAAIHAALDHGVTLIDTAPVYGLGDAEKVVGKAIRGRRPGVVVATKLGLAWDELGKVVRDSRPGRVRDEVEASLRRLGTDWIDLVQVHWPDPLVPFEDTARALEDLRQEGKVRAIGVSNFDTEQMDTFRAAAPLHTAQPPYNLFERGAQPVLDYCKKEGVVSLTYGALCRGLLSGKVDLKRQFAAGDIRRADPKLRGPRRAQYVTAVERLDALARERYDVGVLEMSVRWVLDQPGVGVALWGARRPSQLEPLARLWGWHLGDAGRADIDRIVAETVLDPVGPEFMAPPARHSMSEGTEVNS